jgi:AcrR family transcriptional regulator
MSTPPDRRARKRQATRQLISDAATRLFFERGFDQVTVDDIAEAADVGRMTVFNHFPRKEDMFFDLDDEGREDIVAALTQRDPNVAPIEALRLFAHRAVAQRKPYVHFSAESQKFIETIQASEALKGRARAIRDELTLVAAQALGESVGRSADDPDARLAAGLQIAVWGVAFLEAHRTFRQSHKAKLAHQTLLALVDKGAIGLDAMLAGTPYAGGSR